MKKNGIVVLAIILPVILAGLCLWKVVSEDNQAEMPIPLRITMTGEYSRDGEQWNPYTEDTELSALDGALIVRGTFDTKIEEGTLLAFYCNHIGTKIYVNGEMLYMDAISEIQDYGIRLMPSVCGKRWERVLCPEITTEDVVEFHFINPHKQGNEQAYNEVLNTFYLNPGNSLVMESYLEPYCKPFENLGGIILIVAVMVLGAALAAALLKSSIAYRLFKLGMLALFAGGYIVFDVMMVYFADDLLVVKTYGRQLCMMLAMYCITWMVRDMLTGKNKKIAEILMGISGVTNVLLILAAMTERVLLFDTQGIWRLMHFILCPVLCILCVSELIKHKKLEIEKLIYICLLSAVLLDLTGFGYHMFYQGICAKIAFTVSLGIFLIRGIKIVIIEHHASISNKKLKEELENSHIALMLSQIQPHFIYNTLGTIGEFCEEEPQKAADLVEKFSLYLRGNFTELDNPMPIRFSKELKHVKHYADIEQIRFPDMQIEYDIQSDNFLIPALTVQPLVENAIKHGLMGLETGGTVRISSYETEQCYEVRVEDNGVGFEDSVFEDGKKHIGIKNIRKRIEAMSGGKLMIHSTVGKGTVAIVQIPKEGELHDSTGSR